MSDHEDDIDMDLRMAGASQEMLALILVCAVKHQVCPVCLTDLVAAIVEHNLERGHVHHGIPGGEIDLEDMPTFGGPQ